MMNATRRGCPRSPGFLLAFSRLWVSVDPRPGEIGGKLLRFLGGFEAIR